MSRVAAATSSRSAESPVASVVITGVKFGYPFGSGATTRVRSYAKGLKECGARVHVVSLLTPDHEGTLGNELARGVHDGVSFEYACGTRVREPTFVRRRLLEARVPLGLWRAARETFRGAPGPKAVIAYTDQPLWIAVISMIAHALRAKCIVEVCEVPFVNERGRFKLAVKRLLQDAVAYRLVDGFVAISSYLEDYVRRHAARPVAVVRVPIMVSLAEYSGEAPPAAPAPRAIVYVGGMGNEREAHDVIRVFSLVAAQYDDIVLQLVGEPGSDGRRELAAAARDLGVGDRLVFMGSVRQEQLPALLRAATMLVLPRRSGEFSRAGFPTKLGEYLASGRPVVVTATGDIPSFLTHGVDAFLVAPDDLPAFAAQMRAVLDDEEAAREVGASGRALAARSFDYRTHGKRLHEFLRSL